MPGRTSRASAGCSIPRMCGWSACRVRAGSIRSISSRRLQEGADGVLVSGCHPGDCHYISGNLVARRKFAMLKSFLGYLGIEPERVQFSWVSASEGGRFAALIEKVVADVKKLKTKRKLIKEEIAA